MFTQPRIYLCSQSPRRRELLKQIGVNVEVLLLRTDPERNEGVDETPHRGEDPVVYVQRVSEAKARAGWNAMLERHHPAFPVLAADTTVTLDGEILGKPTDADDAMRMLRSLSGREHEVLTAVAVLFERHFEMRLSRTRVTFDAISEERLHHYVLSNEPFDKAGAYGIQGHAASFVRRIEGSYTGVVGLPLAETVELLTLFGYPVP